MVQIAGKRKPNTYIEHEDYYEMIINSPKFGTFNILFDKEDLEKVQKYTWCISMCHNKKTNTEPKYYASTGVRYEEEGKKKQIGLLLHRYLMDAPKGMVVDHISRNELDNRKENLRICTQSQNLMNYVEKPSNNVSGHIGVIWVEKHSKWMAYLSIMRKHKTLGYFVNFDDAVEARRQGELKYYGEYRSEK